MQKLFPVSFAKRDAPGAARAIVATKPVEPFGIVLMDIGAYCCKFRDKKGSVSILMMASYGSGSP
jgi:hypothetical protein